MPALMRPVGSKPGRSAGRSVNAATLCGFAALSIFALSSSSAKALSLTDALSATYEGNPQIKAQRAALRGTDEEIPRARSGFRPRVTVNGNYGFRRSRSKPSSAFDGNTQPGGYGVLVRQPIFRGFRTLSSVREAEAGVLAGREDLRLVEQDVMLAAVRFYLDIIRDRSIVNSRQVNVRALQRDLDATLVKFEEQAVTRTDVAQSRARLNRARANLRLAEGNLRASRANFREVVGRPGVGLAHPRDISNLLPPTQQAAVARGQQENPLVLSAVFRELAATHSIRRIRGEVLPELNLEGSYQKSYDSNAVTNQNDTVEARLTLSIPFYQGGEVAARSRQAVQLVSQRRQEINNARRQVRADVLSFWAQREAARAQIRAGRSELAANREALDGVKAEEKEGNRTVLDVLNAQQELVASQVALATARRDYAVASYSLLAATGRLDVVTLRLRVEYYDPELHYWNVKRKWFGFGPRIAHR